MANTSNLIDDTNSNAEKEYVDMLDIVGSIEEEEKEEEGIELEDDEDQLDNEDELAEEEEEGEEDEDEDEDDEEEDDFDLDAELEGIQVQDFQDFIHGNHIFYVRVGNIKRDKRKHEEGITKVMNIVLEILATESEEAAHTVGGLFGISFVIGGTPPEYEKYSGTKQIMDGKARLKGFLLSFKTESKVPSEAIEEILERYEAGSGKCAKVRITARDGGEYVNYKKIRVMQQEVPIEDIMPAEVLADWQFYVPFEE
jgi:hypothetical protein